MKFAVLLVIFSFLSNSADSLRELYSKPAEKNIEIVLGKGELRLIETVSSKEYFRFESQGQNNGATVVFSTVKGRYDYFDYMVILDTKQEIINIRILKYRSEFGYEISNKGWLFKGREPEEFGEQPIDVAYTILALDRFYDTFFDDEYLRKMNIAFNWFSGNNRLHHIVYNPCTGGCYDGLEETHVNLNQGAESIVSYLMARMTIMKYKNDS